MTVNDHMGDTALQESSSDDESNFPDTRKSSKRLKQFLTETSQWSAFEKTNSRFVANGVAEDIIDERAIKASLRISDPSPEELDLIEFILDHARKAFAIAVLAQANTNVAMRWLKTNGYDDKKLPIRQQVKPWNQSWRSDFFEKQWMIFAPTFSRDVEHLDPGVVTATPGQAHELEEAHILPFIEKLAGTDEGSFGQVTKYVLHKDHMNPVSE